MQVDILNYMYVKHELLGIQKKNNSKQLTKSNINAFNQESSNQGDLERDLHKSNPLTQSK